MYSSYWNKVIIPCINKIDSSNANVENTLEELEYFLETPADRILKLSAKLGTGVDQLIDRIISDIPPPVSDLNKPFQASVFGSIYDAIKGYLIFVSLQNGTIKKGSLIRSLGTGKLLEVYETGLVTPVYKPQKDLTAGSVGYIIANIKSSSEVLLGDTLYDSLLSPDQITPKISIIKRKPMVYAGIFPESPTDNDLLTKSIDRVSSLDSSIEKSVDVTPSMGFGYRCGFSGILHLDVFRERLEKEEGMKVIITPPTVSFKLINQDGKEQYITNAANLPPQNEIRKWEEPIAIGIIVTPKEHVKSLCNLCELYRGKQLSIDYSIENSVIIKYELPLCEIVGDFHDKIQSISSGYASFDYQIDSYKPTDISVVKMAVNGEEVDSLCYLIHQTKVNKFAKSQCLKLKSAIPAELFPISIQGIVGKKVIAKEMYAHDIECQHCEGIQRADGIYLTSNGGDYSRRKKLLERQKEGKKFLREIGKVKLTAEIFTKLRRLL